MNWPKSQAIDILLTHDLLSSENLRKEGTDESRIRLVGNIMIDSLESNRHLAEAMDIKKIIDNNLLPGFPPYGGIKGGLDGSYAVMTLHRPSNVDTREVLEPLINFLLSEVSQDHPLIWPIHPRARKQLIDFGLWEVRRVGNVWKVWCLKGWLDGWMVGWLDG